MLIDADVNEKQGKWTKSLLTNVPHVGIKLSVNVCLYILLHFHDFIEINPRSVCVTNRPEQGAAQSVSHLINFFKTRTKCSTKHSQLCHSVKYD